ncbi:MAG: hypothetical protein ORN29_02935 [Rhodoferax sp.]|nr:hypothetical protein [Rhodoferax sp.]
MPAPKGAHELGIKTLSGAWLGAIEVPDAGVRRLLHHLPLAVVGTWQCAWRGAMEWVNESDFMLGKAL